MDLPSSRQALGNVARAHLDLPSPASEDISLVTPGLGQPCSSIDSVFALQQWRTADALPEVATLTAAEPGTVQLPQVLTPAQESAPVLSLDAVVGAAVNPVPSSNLPLRPITLRAAHGLRLPSFESLGIANRRPEILRDTTQYNASIAEDDSEDVSSGADAVDTLAGHDRQVSQSIFLPTSTSQAPTRKSLHPFLGPLTPPEDQVSLQWDSVAKDSDLGSESANTGSLPPQRPGAQASNAHGGSSSAPAIRLERSASDRAKGYWLDQTAGIMMSNLQSAENINSPVRVLSHALPCPSPSGYAAPYLISSLHAQTPTSPTCWINVFHALPGRFNLSDLPTSPPNTPGPAVGGDDYFTSKVFDSAVPILDYQDNVASIPRSPRPVVPPSTINVSIVERYIPPTNTNEFADLFNIEGRSLLVDRLIELSPSNGTLIFVYPTKRGAQTFIRDYLGPIIDPLLRSMCIINGFSVDLGAQLARMEAVESMLTHEIMKRRIEQLCRSLNNRSGRLDRFHGQQASFQLQHASEEEVYLDRDVWARNWWVKQEKPRVREILTRYFRVARNLPPDSEVAPTSLIHQVLDGVASRPYGSLPEPTQGVAVSMFVIRRTQ